MRMSALFLSLFLATSAVAWETPQRGTALRGDLMDAIRPHAEWVFGAPLVFRVDDLRVDGAVAFAMLEPQRPDGRPMTAADVIPEHGADDIFELGGPSMQVLYQKAGNTWVATHWAVGATDVWWSWQAYCPTWWSVIPEVCAG